MYQHYDVQPVDPLNEWKRDPFDPTMADGKFWGRGCGDTKGNLIMQLLAVQAWQRVEGRPPINLKFVVEGEEEVGSPHFASFVHANKEILKADGATIEGGDHLHEGTPKIELGCKGILYVEMVSRTASVDQHSSYAAIAPNPGWRLIHAPTCTICGFVSGYIEEGTKTVNPAVARAKIDFRLVPNMKKERQLEKLRAHMKAKGFEDIELLPAPEKLEAAAISLNARVVKAAIKGSVDAYGREPEVWPWSAGASAHGFFNEVVGVPSISGPGVSYDGSNYHAPNENIRLTDFIGGSKHMAAMFARM